MGRERGAEGLLRRADQHDRPCAALHRLRQRGQQQLPGMRLGRGLQQLGHRAHRPATAGQLRIERRMAGADDLPIRHAQRVPAPDLVARGSREGVEGRQAHDQMTVFLYSILGAPH
ncbi:hypothetical protein APY03_4752 [Variovorax sp. WDL1]|nr:hypothetical protein APY03_4752 [Variovorax sp. WDL1]